MVDLRIYWAFKWKCRVDSWIYEFGVQLWVCGVGVSSLDDIYSLQLEYIKSFVKFQRSKIKNLIEKWVTDVVVY